MANALQSALNTANETQESQDLKAKELFSATDLQEFTGQLKDPESAKILLEGFDSEATIDAMKAIPGLEEEIKIYVGSKKDLANIFGTDYDPLQTDHDLYEACILGGILENKKVGSVSADYKDIAKAYFDKINENTDNPTKDAEITETFVSGSSDNTEIGEQVSAKINISESENITKASISVSAGADKDIMPIEKAKTQLEDRKTELRNLAKEFSTDNQAIINTIIDKEFIADNIEYKIIDKNTNKTDNKEQHGNRYLIAARLAEGLIETLKQFNRTPEPTLELKIDREKCAIGTATNNTDKESDRNVTVDMSMTVTASDKPQTLDAPAVNTQQGQQPGVVSNNQKSSGNQGYVPAIIPGNQATGNTNVGGNNVGGSNVGGNNVGGNNVGGSNVGGNNVGGSNVGGNNVVNNNVDVYKAPEGLQENVETAEIIALKKEIAEHFKLNGKTINRETDIANTIYKTGDTYNVSIAGYTGIEFTYDAKKDKATLKANTVGGVRKGLYAYNMSAEGTDNNRNIKPTLNSEKTKAFLETQLKNNDKDGDGVADYKIKTIAKDKIVFEYGVAFVQKRGGTANEKMLDTFEIKIDENNNLILPDSAGAGEVSAWTKKEGTIARDKDFIFNSAYKFHSNDENTAGKIVYYTQTKVDENGIPQLMITNNIQKKESEGQGTSFRSIYPEHEEISDPSLLKIQEDFLNNKIERIFEGSLNEGHENDFDNNRKITKGTGKDMYNFQITFNKNDGKQETLDIAFKATLNPDNSRNYEFKAKQFEKVVFIDNIAYDIELEGKTAVPSIKMTENRVETLNEAEKKTNKNIFSDIFNKKEGDERFAKENGKTYEVQPPIFSLGPVNFEKGGYKRTLFFGEQKDDKDNILREGKEMGTVYYDKDYKIISVKVLKDGKETELDFMKPENTRVNMENVLEDANGTERGAILSPKIDVQNNTSNIRLDFQAPDSDPKKNEREKNRQTKEYYTERIRQEKETIFGALQRLSTSKLSGKEFLLPPHDLNDETKYTDSKLIGPDGNGVYEWKIVKPYTKGNVEYLEQNIYCKVEGKNLQLCDNEGGDIGNKMYIFDYKNNVYHEIQISEKDPSNFAIGETSIETQRIPNISTDEVTYKNNRVDMSLKTNTIQLLKANLFKNTYTFSNNKYEMCNINLDENKELIEDEGAKATKPKIVEIGKAGFGSYQNYFAGEGREDLGLEEKAYEEAFTKIYEEKTNEYKEPTNLIRVKLRSKTDKKYYYEYMGITQKRNNTFELKENEAFKAAKLEMKKRLDNLVLIDKMKFSSKGDLLRGVKINTKDETSRKAYLLNTETPINIKLTTSTGEETTPIQVTMTNDKKWTLANNTELTLGSQNINCELTFKEELPVLSTEVIIPKE